MKKYLDLSLDEAICLAVFEGRAYKYHPESEDEDAWLEVSSPLHPGYRLDLEDGKVSEYSGLDWL